jgi:drug/metabolite transporter (DMT)-like permease
VGHVANAQATRSTTGTIEHVKHTHFFQLVGLSALWGAAFLFIRVASPVLGPWVLAGLRVAMATATLGVLMWVLRQHWPWHRWPALLRLGLLAVAVPFLLYAWAALQLPAGYLALINTTAVLFASLAAAWLGDDRLTRTKMLGCVVGFVGVGLIVRLGPIEPTPDRLWAALACVLAAACYGTSTPLMKRATRHIEPLAIAMGMNVAAGLMLLPGTALAWPQAQFSTVALLSTAMLGVFSSGLAGWMHLRIMRHVSPVAAVSPAFMIPLFGVTWGHLVLGEPLGTGLIAGGALVLLATALVTGFNPVARWLAADAASPKP